MIISNSFYYKQFLSLKNTETNKYSSSSSSYLHQLHHRHIFFKPIKFKSKHQVLVSLIKTYKTSTLIIITCG